MAAAAIPQTECLVYWLYDETCFCPWKHGYVGITTKTLKRRLRQHHIRKRYPHCEARILFAGTEAECLALEGKYRPDYFIAWNTNKGGEPRVNHTDDVRDKLRLARKRQAPISIEARERIRIANTGRTNKGRLGQKKSDEERAKISASKTGEKHSSEHTAKVAATKVGNKYRLGATLSEQSRMKISEKKRGVPIHSEEHKQKLRERLMSNSLTKGKPWSEARRLAQQKRKE